MITELIHMSNKRIKIFQTVFWKSTEKQCLDRGTNQNYRSHCSTVPRSDGMNHKNHQRIYAAAPLPAKK